MAEVLEKSISIFPIEEKIHKINFWDNFINDFKKKLITNLSKSINWNKFFDISLNYLLNSNLLSIKVKNIEHLSFANAEYPDIYYSFQSRTLDLIISYILSKHIVGAGMMINFDNNEDINEANNLYTCIDFLRKTKSSIWMGIDKKAIVKKPYIYSYGDNIIHICSNLDGANVYPICHKFSFSKNRKAQILFEIGKPITLSSVEASEDYFANVIESEIEELNRQQRLQLQNKDYSGYDYSLM